MSIYGRMKRRSIRIKARLSGKLSSEEVSVLGNTKEFDLFFADDSTQNAPSRPGMNQLVGIGGINVNATAIGALNSEIEKICNDAGFPDGEEFKWSPGRELWMHDNLIEGEREDFFLKVLST